MSAPEDMPREPYAFTTVQFYVPRVAADAIDTNAIAERARAAGVERTRFEVSTYRVPPTQARITCQRLLAPYIVEAFVALAERARGDLVVAAATAAQAGLDALAPRNPSSSEPR